MGAKIVDAKTLVAQAKTEGKNQKIPNGPNVDADRNASMTS